MTARDHLFYGFGQIVYCLSFSDGKIQEEEKRKLESIVKEVAGGNADLAVQVTHIIFQLLEKEQLFTSEEMLNEGIKNMKLGDHYLTEELKSMFLKILQQIAEAFPPTTREEMEVVTTFKNTFNY